MKNFNFHSGQQSGRGQKAKIFVKLLWLGQLQVTNGHLWEENLSETNEQYKLCIIKVVRLTKL